MAERPHLNAADLEQMSADERHRAVSAASTNSVQDLDPKFRESVQAKGRRILQERGLLGSEFA